MTFGWSLGRGETSVLAVAMERSSAIAVLDDAAARTCAKSLGIGVIGTLGVVLQAKRKGIISSVVDVLKALRLAGLHLDDDVARSALESVAETWD